MSDEKDETAGDDDDSATARERERGDVAEPDAPTAAEENEAMSTVLSADPLFGVQRDAGDE